MRCICSGVLRLIFGHLCIKITILALIPFTGIRVPVLEGSDYPNYGYEKNIFTFPLLFGKSALFEKPIGITEKEI
jgi:hypothetical protein